MEGTLLSGMYAPANSGGKGEPLPGLIRIKNLAILPNSVKADLKGCFVIVEAQGSLSTSAPTSVSTPCHASPRTGNRSSTRGSKDTWSIRTALWACGEPSYRRWARLSRGASSRGLSRGFGDAVAQSTTTTSISPLGTTQTFNTDEAAKAGAGKGLSQAGHDLQRFLLDLGKQAIPAIEVGAIRPVTVVISEGVDLEIKEKKNGCLNGDAACATPVF